MGLDYALVHLKFTIPPALFLTWLCGPILNHADRYKIVALVIIAIVSTIPWDSYLIRTRVWTYPADAVLGPTLYSIPIEEVFFFFIQTYLTSLLYVLVNKATLFPAYLRGGDAKSPVPDTLKGRRTAGQVLFVGMFAVGVMLVQDGGKGTYLGLIIVWAVPFLCLMWSLSYQFLVGLPWEKTVLPIAIPTVYLWLVDDLALGKGTWVIESGTKVGFCLWGKLDLEEAFFFLISNALVVFGLVSCDACFAILDAFPDLFPSQMNNPSPVTLIKAISMSSGKYDGGRIKGIQDAALILRKKSRSFSMASGVFPGRVRIDLTLLYAFCRAADDLVDDANSAEEATVWVDKLQRFLDISYSNNAGILSERASFIEANFPRNLQAALDLLPTTYLPSEPLYSLLDGFRTDVRFKKGIRDEEFPIENDADLKTYCAQVASTISTLCLSVFAYHSLTEVNTNAKVTLNRKTTKEENDSGISASCFAAGAEMGIALQLVNIARDISKDAGISRVYIPSKTLEVFDLTPTSIIAATTTLPNPLDATKPIYKTTGLDLNPLRTHILSAAVKHYTASRTAIDSLPREFRGPVRVMVDSYIEIGKVMSERMEKGEDALGDGRGGRATVPFLRRLRVVWKAGRG